MQRGIWQTLKNRGVVVLGVNCGEQGPDPYAKARAFRARHGLTYPIAVDVQNEVMKMYGVRAFPTNCVIDRQGVVRYLQSGFDSQGIINTLAQL